MPSTRKPIPATKQDLHSLEERVTKHFDREINHAIAASEKRIVREFKVAVETIRHDLKGANRDEIELIKDDIKRLKQHTHYVAA
jgi:hypothetical protein